MKRPEDDGDSESYGTVRIDGRGRLTIPETLRDDLALEAGTTFDVSRSGSEIHLVARPPDLQTLTRDEEWTGDAFRDAGAATFGEPE
ncbi:AbrB/MazE/SpoVT family DNA-binding domain-containing protein [Halobaculum sp. MBLA0147]|uniref:AbrB/MazE/SpoVT family DNA-binding domain-containing protein n=1 Tax=Halobaculum sp. MBLA0147 TaxID=3079934 RepID=UPI003524E350